MEYPEALNLQRASIQGVGARSGLWLGLGFWLRLKHAGRLRIDKLPPLHVSYRQQWLKQSPDIALWRRDGLQHAEDIRRQQAEYYWTQI